MDNVVVFSLSSSKELTEKICKKLGIKEGKIEIRHFADGEILVELLETVRDKRVYIIQSTDNPVSQNLMELLIAIDSVKRAFAKRIDVIIPYFGYARQDRKARPRQPITGTLVANLLEAAGATSIMTVEIHSTQTMGFFDIPADDLTVIGILAGYFKKKKILKDIVIVSPDHGGVKRARDIAEIFNAPIAIIEKRRVIPNEAAGTLVSGIKMLKEKGAKEIYAAIAHPVLSGPAIERIQNSDIKKLICTDTIKLPKEKQIDKIEVVSISDMLADIIHANNVGESVTAVVRKYRDLDYTDK